ncbi:MAG: hypothetical protein ACRETX_12160, partial [Steroidobacteraceae bacterium]
PRERDQIAIVKTVADLSGLTEHAIATGGIAGEHTLQREGKEQVPLFDAVLVCALEQFAPARDPAAGPRALAVVHQAEPKPEGTSGGACEGAKSQEGLMRTSPDLCALRVLADQVRGRRETFEIVRLKRRIPIHCRQDNVRIRPRAAIEGVSTPVEVVSRRHVFRTNLLDRRA